MRERLLQCPACHAPLTPPSRFARSMDCAYCGAHVVLEDGLVETAPYREALATWNAAPARAGQLTVAGSHWVLGPRLGQGAHADVHLAARARRPTQLAVIHLARGAQGARALENAVKTLGKVLGQGRASSSLLAERAPMPLYSGQVLAGVGEGNLAAVFVRRPGFRFTLREARERFGFTLDAHQVLWMVRRVCEALSALHDSDVTHGAVLPEHLLIEEGEHGVALLGFGSAGPRDGALHAWSAAPQDFPSLASLAPGGVRGAALDLRLLARTMVFGLGGDARELSLPKETPALLGAFLRQVAEDTRGDARGIWTQAGALGTQLGGPRFAPLRFDDNH